MLNADRQEHFFPLVFAKEANLNQCSGSFPAACDNQRPGLAWSGLVWSDLIWPVSYNFCHGERPRKPNCNTETSLNMSRTEGWLVWGGTWQPSLYELTPQYTDNRGSYPPSTVQSKVTSPLVICALLYLCFRILVAVQSNKPHYVAGEHKSTRHHTSDDNNILNECKGSTIDFQISY